MKNIIAQSKGRSCFGEDADSYHKGRINYPSQIYEILSKYIEGYSLRDAFEVGPGTGQATDRLLNMGLTVTAIEPDLHLSNYLTEKLGNKYPQRLRVINKTFEETMFESESFDLGIAAMSWHWLDPLSSTIEAFRILKPGGCIALWWTVFEGRVKKDDFYTRTEHLFSVLSFTPSYQGKYILPFALQTDLRITGLASAGFKDIVNEVIDWEIEMNATQTRSLISTFSNVLQMETQARTSFLNEIERIVNEEYGGKVMRYFTSIIYLARKPYVLQRT
ncbi:class I SAM-dependent methyltransferase [Enterobacter ludwigii]|nr:class I SAM-dependent methyltransferase [Enterobacter ludwigii]